MAFLRSSKFVRYFSSFARNFVFNSGNNSEGTLLQQSQSLCAATSHGFATAAANSNQLDRSLKRLDQDVRRSGRISRRDIEEILDEIKTSNTATSSQSLMVIRCCGNLVPEELPETRTALVQEIWRTLNALKVPMDISHYNALLRVYLENEHPFSPTEFLTDLEAKGVEPNRVTYQRLISRYCQDGDIEGATRILEFMKEKQLPVNENVFNALIMGHSQADDMESARGILTVMKQTGLEPSADSYTTLLCGYARKGDIESINSLLEECEKNEIYLLDKDLLDIIYALCTNGFASSIDTILARIQKSAGYNQDAVNVILRLINKGHEDVAFKILKTMPRGTKADGQTTDTGAFYIRHLVKAQRPAERILAICKELEAANLNSRALLIAVEAALANGLIETATPLLKAAHAEGLPIRQHYFWPLICSASERGQNQVIDILQAMQTEFNISASGETIRDYVIPNLKEKNYDKVLNLLRSGGATVSTAHSNVVYYAVCENDLKKAADISSQRRAFYNPSLFRRPLLQALNNTKDTDSYVRVVRQIYENLPRMEEMQAAKTEETEDQDESAENVNELNSQQKQKEMLGLFIYDAAVYFRANRVEMLELILQGFVDQGLSISNNQADRIQERLAGAELTEKISTLLGKLAAGDLAPVAVESSNGRSRGNDIFEMDIEQIERLITNLEAKGENVKSLKRQLLIAAIKKKNLTKTTEIINRLESENYVISSGAYAQLIELYCINDKLDEALAAVEKIRAKEPEFVLDDMKKVHIVQLMCQQDKYDEAVKFLNNSTTKVVSENGDNDVTSKDRRSFNYNSTIWRLLNSIAEKGKAAELNSIFDALVKTNTMDVTNVLLGPLVKVHLVNNDLTAAVNAFESICQKHRSTPWKNELACRLIQAEDAANLQRLTDLSTDIHGEVNSLYDLVFSFVECGRIRQARKILETPGLRTRPQRINSACERYLQEGLVQPLEGLMEATKDLSHIDRADIYQNLLLSYIKEKDAEKALGLWTSMQEDEMAVTPSDTFLRTLGEFLKANNYEVPFMIPGQPEVPKTATPVPKTKKTKKTEVDTEQTKLAPKVVTKSEVTPAPNSTLSEPMQQMKKAIRSRDVDQILTAHQKLTANDKLNLTDQSIVIESLVKSDRLNEANKIVQSMLENNAYPIPRIFRFYLNKIAQSGDTQTLESMEKLLNPEIKKVISFDNRLCHANIVAGKSEQYLNKLEKDLTDVPATDAEKIKAIGEKFPRGGAAGILEQMPQLNERFEKLAEKYAERGILAPMNILWANYFIGQNEAEAQRIWDKHLVNAPRLMFQRIIQLARESQDEKLVERLLGLLKKSAKVSEGAIGNAYSCLLDIQSNKQEYDRALDTLNVAIKDVCLENFNRTALVRIKEGLEKTGKQFPHKIPERSFTNTNAGGNQNDTTSSSSSSSSSSDEDRPAPKPATKK